MWQQGDAELTAGLEMAPVFDRRQNKGLRSMQVAFFGEVVMPLYADLAAEFPGTKHIHAHARQNHQHWCAQGAGQSDRVA